MSHGMLPPETCWAGWVDEGKQVLGQGWLPETHPAPPGQLQRMSCPTFLHQLFLGWPFSRGASGCSWSLTPVPHARGHTHTHTPGLLRAEPMRGAKAQEILSNRDPKPHALKTLCLFRHSHRGRPTLRLPGSKNSQSFVI